MLQPKLPGRPHVARSHPCGEGFDGVDDELEAEGTEQVEGVLGAGKLGVDNRTGRDAAQPAAKRLATSTGTTVS